jgi:hypothetical protein
VIEEVAVVGVSVEPSTSAVIVYIPDFSLEYVKVVVELPTVTVGDPVENVGVDVPAPDVDSVNVTPPVGAMVKFPSAS